MAGDPTQHEGKLCRMQDWLNWTNQIVQPKEHRILQERRPMEMDRSAQEKLSEIQEMARRFHSELKKEFDAEMFSEGGCLFLGRNYGQSDRIYFGLNPGTGGLKLGHPFDVEVEHDGSSNRPFNNSDQANKDIRYFGNWHRFLSAHADLRRWFNDRVTSTFLVPWRTHNGEELADLSEATDGKLYNYSGQLVRKMTEHHDAKLLIVGAKRGLHLLNELLGVTAINSGGPWDPRDVEKPFDGPGGIYQWRKRCFDGVTVLQIPHFSWARSLAKLEGFAAWLREELRPFGLDS